MFRNTIGFAFLAFGIPCIVVLAITGVSYGGNTVTLPVSVNLTGTCSITNTPSIDFGTINPLDDKDNVKTDTLEFTCTKDTKYSVELDKGQHYTNPDRNMKNETEDSYISYALTACAQGSAGSSSVKCDITGTISKDAVKNKSKGKFNDNVIITVTATD